MSSRLCLIRLATTPRSSCKCRSQPLSIWLHRVWAALHVHSLSASTSLANVVTCHGVADVITMRWWFMTLNPSSWFFAALLPPTSWSWPIARTVVGPCEMPLMAAVKTAVCPPRPANLVSSTQTTFGCCRMARPLPRMPRGRSRQDRLKPERAALDCWPQMLT